MTLYYLPGSSVPDSENSRKERALFEKTREEQQIKMYRKLVRDERRTNPPRMQPITQEEFARAVASQFFLFVDRYSRGKYNYVMFTTLDYDGVGVRTSQFENNKVECFSFKGCEHRFADDESSKVMTRNGREATRRVCTLCGATSSI